MKNLDKIKKLQWKELTQRDHVPPLPVLYKLMTSSDPEISYKIYGFSIPWIGVWDNDRVGFYGEEKQLKKASNWLINEFTKPVLRKKHLQKLINLSFEARSFAKKEIKSNAHYFKKLTELQGRGFILGMVTWFIEDLYNEAKKILEKYNEKLFAEGYIIDQALAEVVDHGQITDYIKKQNAIDKLAKRWSKTKMNSNVFKSEVNNFLEKYGWIGYDYTGPLMSFNEVVDYIKQYKPKKKEKKKNRGIFEICNFSRKEKNIFSTLATIAFMKDLRNSSDDFIHYHLDLLLKSVAKELKVDSYNLRFLWPKEFEDLLTTFKNPKLYSSKEAQLAYMNGPEDSLFIRGKKAKEFFNMLKKRNISDNKKEIKGMIAWSGKITGKVKIVGSYRDMKKVEKGDVLVSPMTSPRIINAMHKASAIITDEGGLTCHAAIISRELKKPCIVGTKNATEVLKDGDLVEVDANKGVVKILKKYGN